MLFWQQWVSSQVELRRLRQSWMRKVAAHLFPGLRMPIPWLTASLAFAPIWPERGSKNNVRGDGARLVLDRPETMYNVPPMSKSQSHTHDKHDEVTHGMFWLINYR